MRKLDRNLAKKPDNWSQTARKAVPDHPKFEQRATEFEALDINDPQRRAGFQTFAPEVLPKRGFKSSWGRHKEEIAKISHGKCSYCECRLNADCVMQVEHFKPKALFPLSAYDWDNYLLACGGCNMPKSDNWPTEGEYVRPDHPAYTPEAHFQFRSDGDVDWLNPEAERTVIDFELRRKRLVDDRRWYLDRFVKNVIDDILELTSENYASALRKASILGESLNDPEFPYSTAFKQYASAALRKALPGFSI